MILSLLLSLSATSSNTYSLPIGPPEPPPARFHWFDVDLDGDLDALAVEPGGSLRLLLHGDAGAFSDATASFGLGDVVGVDAALPGDADGDGDPDLVLVGPGGLSCLQLVGGAYVDATTAAGLEGVGPVADASWVDANGDGALDLHVVASGVHRLYVGSASGSFQALDLALASSSANAVLPVDSNGAQTKPASSNGSATTGGVGSSASSSGSSNGVSATTLAGSQTASADDLGPAVPNASRGAVGGRSNALVAPTGTTAAAAAGPPAANWLACVESVRDQAGAACFEASSVPTLGSLFPISPELYVDAATGHVGIGTTTPGCALEVNGQIVSGVGNAGGGMNSTVGGGTSNTASGDLSAIAGGEGNLSTGEGAFVGAGAFNLAVSDRAVIGGGVGNSAAYRSFVGGGDNNVAGGNVTAVAGGKLNEARQTGGFVGGGEENISDAVHATVAGGRENSATGTTSVVAGGRENIASGEGSFVGGGGMTSGGGSGNVAAGLAAVVGGGRGNAARLDHSVVGGGFGNDADGSASTVGGGSINDATGDYSTVPGGRNNIASGDHSFAAGRAAQALHDGAFVWSDRSSSVFASTAVDQFLVEASGGFGVGTTAPAVTFHVDGGTDVKTNGGGYVQIGSASQNIAIDGNEIMARDATGAEELNLNADGGDVIVSGNGGGGNLLVGDELIIHEDEIEHIGAMLEVNSVGSVILDSGTTIAVDAGISLDLQGGTGVAVSSAAGTVDVLGGVVNIEGGVFVRGGSLVLESSSIAATAVIQGTITQAQTAFCALGPCSDGRWKKGVEPIRGILDQLLELEAKTYVWNEEAPEIVAWDQDTQYGFIAQDVLEVFPALVKPFVDEEHFTIAYHQVIPMLVEGLRELRAEKDAELELQAARIATLEGELSRSRSANIELAERMTRIEAVLATLTDAGR